MLFALVALLLSSLFALLVLEAALRVILVRYSETIDRLYADQARVPGQFLQLRDLIRPSANERLIYEMHPNVDGIFAGVPVRTNSAGFRDVERPVAKPPGTYRIAVLGDSVAFGWGVQAEERFTNRLEALLNEGSSRTRVEVLNFGIPGYNSVMELELLRDVALKYEPDVVLVNVVENDAELPNFVREKPNAWALNRLFLVEAVRDRLAGRALGYTARQAGGGLVTTPGFRPDLVPERFQPLIGPENARTALRELREELEGRGIAAYAMVHQPYLDPVLDARRRGEGSPAPNPWVKAAQDAGFRLVDPLPALTDYLVERGKRQEALWVDPKTDIHPNAEAHRILAEVLCRQLALPENK